MTLAVLPSVRARVLLPLIWGIIVRVVAAVVVSAKIVLATAFTVAPLIVSALDPPLPMLPKVMLDAVSDSEIAPKLVLPENPTLPSEGFFVPSNDPMSAAPGVPPVQFPVVSQS